MSEDTDPTNYVVQMDVLLRSRMQTTPYIARTVADEVVEWLRANNPNLLRGWLDVQAEQLICAMINQIGRSTRSHDRATAGSKAFGKAAEAAESGDVTALKGYLGMQWPVDESNTRKNLADMNRGDCEFVAESYHRTAQSHAMRATFFRKLAKKIGDDRVVDHFTEEQLAEMFDSLD